MKTHNFPYIAAGLGLLLMLLVMRGSQPGADGATALPVLTLLIVSEFAFFVTAAGAYIGIRHSLSTGLKSLYALTSITCGVLSVSFLWLGFELWPL